MKTVKEKAAKIVARLARAEHDLRELQSECDHTFVKKVARSNTGNYDPSADAYWYEFTCPDCGKYWHEDQ
jgi:hypothetical protein